MANEQNWQTEVYREVEVHVTPLQRPDGKGWDYSVRLAWAGEDAAADAELTAQAGDDADYPSAQAAVEAGFRKGYAMVDKLLS